MEWNGGGVMRGRSWAWVGLIAALLFDVWWRCHTVGPSLRETLGATLYPVSGAEAEPLDCDEAIYAYIGKRIASGAVMYRDLTENKPPLGYWLFAISVAIGGTNELTVRLMPIPLVLATIVLVAWLALRLRGPGAAVLAAFTYAVMSTDPFLYGNGNQMETMINLFATSALAFVVSAWDRPGRARLVAAGVCLGAAVLVKQVAAVHGVVFALALLFREKTERLKDIAALSLGFVAACGLAALIVIAQGAGREAFEDIFRYGPALATDIPPDPHAPPLIVRWFTGNADPSGALPWPFGRSDYLAWWGTGSWPVWLSALPALAWLVLGPGTNAPRRILAAWTLSAWVQVALPRLFWHHYYLLPVPGLAVVVAVFLADLVSLARTHRVLGGLAALVVTLALVWTARLQVIDYLWLSPEQVTVVDKKGGQWVSYRNLGRELGRRSTVWEHPTLFVWGWQSPLYIYSGLDGTSRQVFVDDLIKTHAGGHHPQVEPRIERTMRELRASPPSLILAGYPPFPALREFLEEHYLPSRIALATADGRGLWVERSRYGAFETRTSPPPKGSPRRPVEPRR